ncbi:hypothetical protein Tco_0908288 [Tanacetum coccineum]|uniref:Uncharacterized protein n=1 Tax=Tanacetum coccineum TaxID=301880 RepID=A0ABQ5CMG2_9ASTR
MEDFMERYKAEVLGCRRCSGMHANLGVHARNNSPGLSKRLYEESLRSVTRMYRMSTSFLKGEVAALSTV